MLSVSGAARVSSIVRQTTTPCHSHNMKKSISLIFAIGALLLTGCNKTPTAASAPGNPTDWGVVEFSVNTPKHLSLADGTDCTLTTTLLADGKLQIVIKFAEKLTEKDI